MSQENWHKNYKEVKNVIHNDIGITKEEIIEVFRQVAKDEIGKIVSENSTFIYQTIQDVIRSSMIDAVKEHRYPKVTGHMWQYGSNGGESSFNDFLSGVMKEEIVKQLGDKFVLNLDIEKK